MLAVERRKIILELLQNEGKAEIYQLRSFFDVSDETLRRDLDQLCQEGLAVKCYGGATLNENARDVSFNLRKTQNPAEKMKIAESVVGLVADGDSIILDASSTAVYTAKMLKKKKELTIVTNSMEVMAELSETDFTVISTGGRLSGPFLAFTGGQALASLSSFYVNKLIFSCKALSISGGIYDSTSDFADVKQAMLKSAKTKILAVDGAKFDRNSFAKIASLSDIDVLVTDKKPSAAWVDALSACEVEAVF